MDKAVKPRAWKGRAWAWWDIRRGGHWDQADPQETGKVMGFMYRKRPWKSPRWVRVSVTIRPEGRKRKR